jgi:hypothetical protein
MTHQRARDEKPRRAGIDFARKFHDGKDVEPGSREAKYRLKESLWCAALYSKVARALSEYYLWLQRTDRPW